MRNLFKLCLIVVCGFLVVTICSCQFFIPEEIVEFELPEWPEYLPELEKWSVNLSGVAEPVEVSPDQKTIFLQLPKNRPCCITVTPVTQTQFFKSAGTIYPYSKSITWSGGYAARLYNTAVKDSSFNWEKLLTTLEEKQQELASFYNPWLLDTQEVLEGIAYHSFSANKLKLSQTVCVELDFEVFSSYVPENEFMRTAETPYVTVKKDVPQLFALRQGSGPPDPCYGLLISASSAKNISLEFISMPIYIKEI